MGNFGAYTEWRHCGITGQKISPELCTARQQCGSIACDRCEFAKKERSMGNKKAWCTVEGCEKQAWKEGMCYHHFHKAQRAKEVPQPTTETITPPPTAETPPEPARLTIMDRVSIVDTPLSKPGFYLDFTGKEDLLKAYKSLSEDVNNDTICLIELSIAGVLRRVA